eukprot:4733829-Amphidinium_carterae.1
MSPRRIAEQQAMIQDFSAVRGQSQSPRAGQNNPYSTPVERPQSLSVDGPPQMGNSQTTLHMHGEQNFDPMSDIVRMTQELIASVQTSADGVTTETMTMQRAMVVR